MDKIGYLQQVVADSDIPEPLRAEAQAAVAQVEAGGPVEPVYQRIRDSHREAVATRDAPVYCGQCGSRLIVCNARNKQGKVYPYFVCSGGHGGGDCTRQAILIEDVEHLIETLYETIQVSAETRQGLAGTLHAEFDRLLASETKELARLAKDRDRLDDSIGLLAHVADIYRRCDDANRRLRNQAFFTAISIDEDGEPQVAYQRPFDALCDSRVQGNALTWAAEAKKKGEVQTRTEVVPLVESLNLVHMG